MRYMFLGCKEFNQQLDNWKAYLSMSNRQIQTTYMFKYCNKFSYKKQLPNNLF